MAKEDVGLICEQGDMGLHYTPLSESDKSVLRRQEEEDDKKSSKRN